jgi:Ser/Thr protein kinase RdoA (MazF antagonist)
MMPLAALDAVYRLVAADRTCPVADEVAAAWGTPPGTARFWRSSASHVFSMPGRYLRFVPATVRSLEAVTRIAELMAVLPNAVPPVPSLQGSLAELVPTRLGPMCATVVEAAPGIAWDAGDLTPEGATAWGTALAETHRAAAGLPWPDTDPFPARLAAGDPAASELLDALRALPADPATFGLIHGDFELDNIAWADGVPTVYDFDEAERSWYSADVAFALREVAHRADVVTAFVAGYRSVRPLDERSLPLFRRLNALRSARSIRAILDADEHPGDHTDLAAKLDRFVRIQQAVAAGELP